MIQEDTNINNNNNCNDKESIVSIDDITPAIPTHEMNEVTVVEQPTASGQEFQL